MNTKNSQILLIENALQGLNKTIWEKDESIRMLESQSEGYKETISSLKYECKANITEQEKLQQKIEFLEKNNRSLKNELQNKNTQLETKVKELDTIGIQNEEFLNSVEHKMNEVKKQIEEKNTIILELQKINKDLNSEIEHIKDEHVNSDHDNAMLKKELKNQRKVISRLQKKLKQEEFKNFIDSKNKYEYSEKDMMLGEELDTTLPKPPSYSEINLDKLENKLKESKKNIIPSNSLAEEKSTTTEEDILRKKLGF